MDRSAASRLVHKVSSPEPDYLTAEQMLAQVAEYREATKADSISSTPRWTAEQRAKREKRDFKAEAIAKTQVREEKRLALLHQHPLFKSGRDVKAKDFRKIIGGYRERLKADSSSERPRWSVEERLAEEAWCAEVEEQIRKRNTLWAKTGGRVSWVATAIGSLLLNLLPF